MKRVLCLILLFCLVLSICTEAHSDTEKRTDNEDTYSAVRALMTNNPDLTPDQAQTALSFLSMVHSKLGDVLLNNGKDRINEAVALLTYISEKDPELLSRILTAMPEGMKDSSPAAYILNIRSNRFHLPGCTGITDMAEKNRVDFFGSRDLLLATGFKPCQICSP